MMSCSVGKTGSPKKVQADIRDWESLELEKFASQNSSSKFLESLLFPDCKRICWPNNTEFASYSKMLELYCDF